MVTVLIRSLTLPIRIGILPRERLAPQRVMINAEIEVIEGAEGFVSYVTAVEHLQGLSASDRHIDLVEELANELLDLILKDDRVAAATVEVLKPDIFAEAEAVGVRIRREADRAAL